MEKLLEAAGQILALLLAFCTILGIVAKYVVLPWLEDRFQPMADKLTETHHQVTVNGHTSEDPTLKDRVDSLRQEVRELKGETRRDLADVHLNLKTIGRVYDRHVEWSEGESERLWDQITNNQERIAKHAKRLAERESENRDE